jgi:DNA-binding response OmpR family regulator
MLPRVLIVDDDPSMLVAIAREIRPVADAHLARDLHDATSLIFRNEYAAAIVDERLGNGCGRDFLGLVRIRGMPTRRVLMCVGEIVRPPPNPAWEAVLVKPFTSAELLFLLEGLLA